MAEPSEVTFGALLLGGIALMLLAGGALVFFVLVYQKRLLEQRVRLQLTEAAYQRQALLAIIEAQEGERERIGQDLHDGLGSTLATAKLLVGQLGTPWASGPPPEAVALLGELIGAAVADVRSVAHHLYPAVLARYGLAEALQHLADVSHEAGPVAVTADVACPRPLALAQELALYRIAQELVHNALKHARGATRIAICLSQRDDALALSVADDGCGFPDPAPHAAAPFHEGAGLHSIDVRVQMLHASLRRETAPGQGTLTRVEVPLDPSPFFSA
jgi:two-component system NarL family sensor kinase